MTLDFKPLIETSRGKGPLTLGQPAGLTLLKGANSCGSAKAECERWVSMRKSVVTRPEGLGTNPPHIRTVPTSRYDESKSAFGAWV